MRVVQEHAEYMGGNMLAKVGRWSETQLRMLRWDVGRVIEEPRGSEVDL